MAQKLSDFVNPALNDGFLAFGNGALGFLFLTTPGNHFKKCIPTILNYWPDIVKLHGDCKV